MDDAKKADVYLDLYKSRLESFYKRRDIEWKVTFGIWTAIAFITGYGAGKLNADFALAFFYIILWLLYSIVWSWGLRYANEFDRQRGYVYLNRLELLIGYTDKELVFEKPGIFGVLRNWSPLAQIIGTALFFTASWFVIYVSS